MFHQRNGFYAERLPNGSVRLVKKNRPSIIELAHGVTEGETMAPGGRGSGGTRSSRSSRSWPCWEWR